MPQIVDIEGVGEVEFDDGLSPDQIRQAIEQDILPRFQRRESIEAIPPQEEARNDNLLGRLGASISENALMAAQGMEKIDRFIPVAGYTSLIRQFAPGFVEDAKSYARELQERSRSDYGVTAPADTFVEKVVEGVGSLPVVLAAPPIAPFTNAALMGESQFQDAERYTDDPMTQAKAFTGGAAMGLVTEHFLGVPAMLRAGGGRRILDAAISGYAREGTQEGVQQLGSNAIALGLYDRERDLSQGVKESIAIGGVIGAPLGAVLQQPMDTSEPEQPDEVLQSFEERPEQPDLSRFGSQARPPAPPPITPEQTVSAAVLGQDPAELRQQKAIITGRPLPEVEMGAQTGEMAYGRGTDPYDAFAGVGRTGQPIPKSQAAVEDEITTEEGQGTTPELPEPSTLSFGDQVNLAAYTSTEGQRYGSGKAFISDVWRNWQEQTGQSISLKEFQSRILSELRAGNLGLSRLDFAIPGSEAAIKAEESLIQDGDEKFNFVSVPSTPPAGPRVRAEALTEGLSTVDADTFERMTEEPIRPGWVGYQDPDTKQFFQVPEGSTPEVIQQRLQEVRAEESEAYRRAREEQLERELMQQRFQENVKRMEEMAAKAPKLMRKDLMAGTPAQEVWNEADQLEFTLARERMRLTQAKNRLARSQSSANQAERQQAQEEVEVRQRGVDILTERINSLKGKVIDATEALKGMKKAKPSPEGGAIGGRGGRRPTADRSESYEIFADQLYSSQQDTKPNEDFGDAEKQAIREAYDELVAETGFPAVAIADVMERAEMPLSNQSKGFLMGMFQNGEITALPTGDWSLSSRRKQAWGVKSAGENALLMEMPPRMNRASGEQGSTTIPSALIDLGATLYQKGMEFAAWSRAMVKNLGDAVKPYLKQIWDTISAAMDYMEPANRRMRTEQRSQGMQRAERSPEGGAIGSRGGRRPSDPLGISNTNVQESRSVAGLAERMAPFRRTFGAVWDEAMAAIVADPKYPSNLVAQLKVEPRPISDFEGAVLLYERVARDNAYERAVAEANAAQDQGDVQLAQEALNRAKQSQEELFEVTESVGTQTARGLAIRRLLVNRDLTLAKMKAETRAIENQGKPLTPDQEKRIEDLYNKLKAAEAKIKELEERQSKEEASMTFKAMMKEFRSDRKEALKEGKGVTEFLNDQAEKARERMRARRAARSQQMTMGVNPSVLLDLPDLAIIGASHIANGAKSLAEFTARLVEDNDGEAIPNIEEVYEQAKQLHESETQAFSKKDSSPSRTETPETPEQVLERATTELDPKLVYDLVRAYVNAGMRGVNEVMNAVHGDLVKLIPDLTVRDVRDAFSGYGKVKHPSKEETKVALRELRTLSRLTSQLEDVQRRRAPLRTGLQRDKLTAEARILQKQISDLMKKYDIRTTSPEQQLKTSIEGVKSRLRNQIEELDLAIRNQEAIPSNRRTIQYDDETKALRDRRDQLRARYNEIFQRPKETAQERMDAILKALDKSIAQESQMLREGIYKRPPRAPQPSNTEIENKRMELDALRQLRRELYARTQPRKSPEDIALEQAIKAAKASIDRMDQMFKTGNMTPAQRAQRFTPTNELEALWSERDAMRDALAELRRAQKPRKDVEETRRKVAIKALEKSIADLDLRLLNNDFSDRPRRVSRPETQRVAELREIRDQMRKTFEELKKAQTPQRSPEEIGLERDKKVIRKRIADLQAKIDAGDFVPPPKKEPRMDREKRQLQFDYQKLRETYLKGLYDAQLKNRTTPQKIWGTAAEILNTSRAILTSMDFSGVLRQGGFIAFGNPVRAAKALGPMFRAFASEKGAFDAEQEIKSRPNYQNGVYQAAKLYFADDASASLAKMEENYMSRWARKIPVVAGSQRAYNTFLNKLRADSFDAMSATLTQTGKPTPEEAKVIANFVNVATGRGNLGQLSNAGVALNTVFFAPRYVLSRFQLLAGQPFYGGNARTRKLIAKEYAKYLIGVGVVLSLLGALQDDDDPPLETDPRSSDFLKVRLGNTRLDPFSGLLQNTTLASRVISGDTKKASGEIVPLRGDDVPYGAPSTSDVIGRFLRTKLSPLIGTGIDLAAGENVVGEKVGPTEAALRMAVPISAGEILETMKEQGIPRGTTLSLLSLFGIGLQTYAPKETTTKSRKSDSYTSSPY